MDGVTFGAVIELVKAFGVPGLVLLIWYVDHRVMLKTLDAYRTDVAAIKVLYENNVKLVMDYERSQVQNVRLFDEALACMRLNTQAMQSLVDSVKNSAKGAAA